MLVQDVLDAAGIYTYHFGAYVGFSRWNITGLTLEQAIQRYWLPMAIRSSTIECRARIGVATKDMLKLYRFAIFVQTDGWGYYPVGAYDPNALSQYDAKRAYGLFKDAQGNYTVVDKINGFVVDEPFLMDAVYKPVFNAFLANNGIDLPAVSIGGWPTSDGAVASGGYKSSVKGDTVGWGGAVGGFSMDSMQRFTVTPYFNSNHSDASPCKLQEQFVSKIATYTVNELILDTFQFHYAANQYPFYLTYANALLEKQIYDYMLQIYGKSFIERDVFYRNPDLDKTVFNGSSIGVGTLGETWTIFMRGVNMSLYINLFDSNRFPPHGGYNNSIDNSFRPPTASECLATYLKWIPFYPHNQYCDFPYWPAEITLDEEKTRITRQYTDYLNRMKFVGGYHGYERPDAYKIKVLVYTYPGVNFTDAIDEHQYTSLSQVEVMGDPDPNMNVLASETYDIFVIENPYPAGYGITALGWQRIRTFVSNGGCLMITYLDNFKSTVFEDLTGVHFTGQSMSHGTLTVVNPDHPILKPYRDTILPAYNPTYYDKGGVREIVSPNLEVLVQSNCGPVCFINHVGNGMVIVLQKGTGWPPAETRQGSTFYTIRGNAFLYAKGQANLIPWMWHDSYTNSYPWGNPNYAGNKVNLWAVPTWASDFTGLIWSLCGKLGGPLLLWVSNVFTVQKDFNLHLRAGFYGLSSEWVLFDAVSLNVIRGVGEDMVARLSLAPTSWMPLYVINLPVEGADVYCSGKVLNRTITDKDTLLTIDEGSHTALTYLVVRMSVKPARIIIDSTEIPESTREAMAMPQTYVDELITEKGWYYDSANQILVLKYRANNLISTVDIIRDEESGLTKGVFDGAVSAQTSEGEPVTVTMIKPDGTFDIVFAQTLGDGSYVTPDYTATKAGDYKAKADILEDADFLAATSEEITINIPKAPRIITIRWTVKP